MDFTSRNAQQPQNTPAGAHFAAATPASTNGRPTKRDRKSGGSRWLKAGSIALLFAVVVLVASMIGLLLFGGNSSQEDKVNHDKYQAVFLNSGQVYFGNIKSLNSSYIDLQNIYYLQTSGADKATTQNSNVSLVKLGCELHAPADQMLINAREVTFWENLKDDGQVAKAIAQYKQQNPNGQKCDTATNQNQSNNNTNNVQGSNGTNQSQSSDNTTAPKP